MTRPSMRYALGLGVAAALLAGCGGSQLPSGMPAGSLVPGSTPTRHVSKGRSWIAPDAGKALLYVSNGVGIVNVYRYWQRSLVGELTDFTQPEGECTDGSGNVYITDYGSSKIVEYAHGKKAPSRAIDTSPYRPYGCAVNPKNGDLAVANYSQASYYSQGSVAVYKKAEGTPTYYTNENLYTVNACAYDKYGDLLVSGFDDFSSSSFAYGAFGYLPAGSDDFELVALAAPSSFGWGEVPGVAWDGKYWAVGGYYGDVYQYSINIKPELVGTVTLPGASAPLAFYRPNASKQATQAVGAYVSDVDNDVYYWNYPAGGPAFATITHGLAKPFGVAISIIK
jgi:hypothetical protein